jgi:hypothetical protein
LANKGKRLNNVSKYKFNLGGEYDQPLPGLPSTASSASRFR